jgi:hypothetical protein
MEPLTDELKSEARIDASLQRAKEFESFPRIVEAVYRPEPACEFLMLRLDNGSRLLIPREELLELKDATAEQASDIRIVPQGRGIWWPQIDDGLYLPDFLEHRWGKVARRVAA